MLGWCLVLTVIGLMSDDFAGEVKSGKVKGAKVGTKPEGAGAKGAWEGGLIIRGRRAEKSRVQRDEGCLIRADRQIIDYDAVVAPKGRHSLPGGKCRQPSLGERARKTTEGSPKGAAQLAGRQVPSNLIPDT
jgi:hypothetical protein